MTRRLDHERINRLEKAKFKPELGCESVEIENTPRPERKPTHEDQKSAESAWEHFNKHGDLSLTKRLADSLPPKLRYSYLRWLKATAPVKLEVIHGGGYKLLKDKDRSNSNEKFDQAEAFREVFWKQNTK